MSSPITVVKVCLFPLDFLELKDTRITPIPITEKMELFWPHWVTVGTKFRPDILSNWSIFELNWHDIESQFDSISSQFNSNILQLLGIRVEF